TQDVRFDLYVNGLRVACGDEGIFAFSRSSQSSGLTAMDEEGHLIQDFTARDPGDITSVLSDECQGGFISLAAGQRIMLLVAAEATYLLEVDFDKDVLACGNGEIDSEEQCDPPNTATCDALCRLKPSCGNSSVDPGEQCDDGNSAVGDG